MNPTRFMIIWMITVAAVLACVATFNGLMDPYAIFGVRRIDGVNAVKPTTQSHSAMVKAYQVERVVPHAVLIGASRVDIGLDPDHPGWPGAAIPVYNYGIPGAGLQSMLGRLRHAASAGRLRIALVGLDFESFLEPEMLLNPVTDEGIRRLATAAPERPNLERERQRLLDMLRSTLTVGATIDSIQTLAAQRQAPGPDISEHGSTSEGGFERIARADGFQVLFTQKELQVVGRYSEAARTLAASPSRGVANLEYVRSMIDFCEREGIELHLFIQPLHATLLEMIHAAGLWGSFEDWKLALLELAEESRARSGRKTPVLWDFAEYSTYTTEVPSAKGDQSAQLNWFWEPGHYKKALGNVMLSRMLEYGEGRFGMKLSRDTIGERVNEVREGRKQYVNENPREVARIAELVRKGS